MYDMEKIGIIGVLMLPFIALLIGIFAGWIAVKIHDAMNQNAEDLLNGRSNTL